MHRLLHVDLAWLTAICAFPCLCVFLSVCLCVCVPVLSVLPTSPSSTPIDCLSSIENSRKQGAERDASVSGKLIERALALDPSHVGALCLEGMWHFKGMGDLQRGLDCLEVCDRLRHPHPSSLAFGACQSAAQIHSTVLHDADCRPGARRLSLAGSVLLR